MFHRNHVCLSALVLFVSICAMAAPARAQTSEYYLHSGDQDTFVVVQNGAIVRSWGLASGTDRYQYPMVVRDTIRTTGANEGDTGAEYDLSGNDLGARYTHPAGPIRSWDGATDGTNFYTIDTGGEIWRFDDTWQNPELLFSVNGLGSLAYDPTNDSLWVSQFSSDVIVEYSLAGARLRGWSTGHTQNMALALDPADGTLWLHDRTVQGTYEQWDKDGNLLARIAIPGMAGFNCLSGEFQVAPSDCLTLEVQNLVAGEPAQFTITNGDPGVKGITVYGLAPGITAVNGTAGYCATFQIAGVNQNRVVGGFNRIFDGNGEISFNVNVPGNTSGLDVLFQSAMRGTCPEECMSNLVEATVQ